MPIHPSKDKTPQPVQSQDPEVEKLYESCCGSCGSPSPTNSSISLDDLTLAPKGTVSGQTSGKA